MRCQRALRHGHSGYRCVQRKGLCRNIISHLLREVLSSGARAQVTVDNIDADLFNTSVRGGMFQPADQMLHKLRTATYDLVRAAFDDCLARPNSAAPFPIFLIAAWLSFGWHVTSKGLFTC